MERMGYEGQVRFTATPGGTASTLLENVRDIGYQLDLAKGNTTVRGDGSGPPVETENTTVRKAKIDWEMLDDDTDTDLLALLAKVYAGEAFALRTINFSGGKGFDGDVTATVEQSEPLEGEATLKFTATPTRSFGRAPQLYV